MTQKPFDVREEVPVKQPSVLIASDSFKGSVSSSEVADLIERGVLRVCSDSSVRKFAIADGGEGTVEAVVSALGGTLRGIEVSGPLGDPVRAHYGLVGRDLAVIEVAESSGITLIEQTSDNARNASSLGLGQMILDAIDQGARKIYIGLGGSATSDGGMGMAKALGVRFLDAAGKDVPCGLAGMETLATIDCSLLSERLASVEIVALTDVTNPLTGPTGAVAVYGPQKGIAVEDIETLDGWMRRYAAILEATVGREVASVPGAGAAGGLGAGLVAFCDARIERGIEAVLDIIDLEGAMEGVDLVITGEGRMDEQSAFGKAPVGVARRAKKHGIPVVAVVGGRAEDLGSVYDEGIDLVLSIATGPITLQECMERADVLLPIAGENCVRAFLLGEAAARRSRRSPTS